MASTRSQRDSRSIGSKTDRGTVPEDIQGALRARLERHVRSRWRAPGIDVVVRFRGRFAYVGYLEGARTNRLPDGGEARPSPLFRLQYVGDPRRWRFALFKYSDEEYELCLGASGSFTATPEQAFDCAARLYLS